MKMNHVYFSSTKKGKTTTVKKSAKHDSCHSKLLKAKSILKDDRVLNIAFKASDSWAISSHKPIEVKIVVSVISDKSRIKKIFENAGWDKFHCDVFWLKVLGESDKEVASTLDEEGHLVTQAVEHGKDSVKAKSLQDFFYKIGLFTIPVN